MTQDVADIAEQTGRDLPTLLALTGDPVALRELHDQATPLLRAAALRLLRDDEAASEAVAAVFLQLWRGQARFGAGDGEPLGWLLAQLRARAGEIQRRRQRDGLMEGAAFRETSFADDLARLAQNQTMAGFHHAFTMLDLEHQQILALAYLDGLSHAELAQRLRMPIGTARAAARAGLERLRHALETTS